MTDPLISCVTVNYRSTHFIRHLLRSVQEARLSFPFEYIVVDNCPGDGCAEMIRERYPWTTVLTPLKNNGFGAGNNVGIRRARGKYVMLVNPDVTMFPGEMEKLIAWMDAHPDVGMCGPRLKNPDGSLQESRFHFHELVTPFLRRTPLGRTRWGKKRIAHFLMQNENSDRPHEVDWILGAIMLIRREALDKIGMFDERYFMYFEEEDLCRRMWMGGFKVVYAPVAEFVHYYHRESGTKHIWELVTKRMARVHAASGIKYYWKYFRKPHPRVGSDATMVGRDASA